LYLGYWLLNMKLKINWPSRIAFLLALLIMVGLLAVGCVSGLTPVGWSGGMVSGGFLYVGSQQGRMVQLNLADDSRIFGEALVPVSSTGLFGCGSSTGGLGCGGGPTGVPVYGTPAVSGNLTYLAGYNGKVYAYNTSNLAVRWVYPREGNLQPIVGGVVVGGGRLFFGCTDGKVYALDAELGDKLWEFTTGDKIWGTPAFLEQTILNMGTGVSTNMDMLVIGSFDKKVYALNPADGTPRWEYATGGSVIATPLIFDSTVYIGSFDRNLYAINLNSGTLRWTTPFTGKNWFFSQPAVWNGTIYAGCLDGFVYALNFETGAKVAEFDLGNPVSSQPVVVNHNVIFTNSKGVIYSIDAGDTSAPGPPPPATNEIRQLADLKKTVNGPLTVNGEVVFIHTTDNILERINAVTGALLTPVSLQP
jgi:eukaryotic-like serine/threonine-protein kinase